MKKVLILISMAIFFSSYLLGKAEISSSAGILQIDSIKYTSVKLEYGDTLYTIATRYNNLGISHEDYISSLKSINNLYSDTIHAGCYVTVSYVNE